MHDSGVGLLNALRMNRYESAIQASFTGGVTDPSTLPLASPWSSSTLERIVAEDVFGSNLPVNTRAAAMRIQSVARARNIMVSTICALPLRDMVAGAPNPAQPPWLSRPATGDPTTPQHRMAWTVDDLIFYGWSLWWRDNSVSDGFPVGARRVNQGDWTIDGDCNVVVNGNPVRDPRDVILMPGLHEGILSYGRDALDDTRALYRNVRKRLATPTPGLNLQQNDGRELTDEEIDKLIDRWSLARQGEHGGVSYTSKNITPQPMAGDDGQLMIEARNAAAVDIARMIGVAAGLIDATSPKASLNYETSELRNQEFVDRDVALYMTPITARLSLDDVTPRGHYVTFDLTNFTTPAPAATGPVLED